MNKPIFIFSIDTEMLWGPAGGQDGVYQYNLIKKNENEMRDVFSTLLNLFEKYNVPVTWAIVGHLFLDRCNIDTCQTTINMKKYGYTYPWYRDPCSNLQKDPLYYGKDIVEKILHNPIKHELAYHSFSHVCFTSISREMAEDEIKESKRIEKEWNIKFISFVYPMNEIAYVDILKKYDFKIYRSKTPLILQNQNHYFSKQIENGLSKIIAPSVEPLWENGIWNLKSSMTFFDSQLPNSLMIRFKIGLERAIKNKRIFHIWLHPWNLFYYKKLASDLEEMLYYVSKKRDNKKITIMTMQGLVEFLDKNK